MPFSMQCNNKGCGQIQSPYIDKETDKVYCSLCDKEIANATIFAKNQMKSLKQFRQKKQQSFAVKCSHCNSLERPLIEKEEYLCGSCKKLLDVSPMFKSAFKQFCGKE